jgi:NAD(P)H-dependent flavin oxidoreductase YrpB (nitropropane dioxygenase family)
MGIELPIFGAGAGSIATAELAAAVTNAGGLGMTGAAGDAADAIVARIRRIRALTDGPLGVNVILQIQPPDAIQAILDEGVDVLATGFGDPAPWVGPAHAAGAKVFHRCESAAEARTVAAGVDVLIAQGSDSGGHTGVTPTFSLVPQIVDAADGLPVLAAGGIADGRGLAAALALGADGVLIGTCLVASLESSAHGDYKQRIVDATAADSC